MDVNISKHATEQATTRGITETGIRMIVSGNQPVVIMPSKIDPDVDVFIGKYNGKIWSVPVNMETFNVVTVRRAWKKEEKTYGDETRN